MKAGVYGKVFASNRVEMKSIIRRFLLLCGTVLVLLRLYPSDPGGWISRLFWDDVIHAKIEATAVQVILFLGFSSPSYQAFASNLIALGHSFTILFQAVAIALIFYIVSRWI